MAIVEMAKVGESSWPRVAVTASGGVIAILVLVAAARLPTLDPTVWGEAAVTAASAVALIAAAFVRVFRGTGPAEAGHDAGWR
jgi:hypothetical protein